jgi:hypothetical protein
MMEQYNSIKIPYAYGNIISINRVLLYYFNIIFALANYIAGSEQAQIFGGLIAGTDDRSSDKFRIQDDKTCPVQAGIGYSAPIGIIERGVCMNKLVATLFASLIAVAALSGAASACPFEKPTTASTVEEPDGSTS